MEDEKKNNGTAPEEVAATSNTENVDELIKTIENLAEQQKMMQKKLDEMTHPVAEAPKADFDAFFADMLKKRY